MKIKSIKPEIRTIGDFFREYAKELAIPSIQRQFVWNDEDIKELIDSILKGYPIGAVIVWEPDKTFSSVPLFGNKLIKSDSIKYVLDGQQRLTSLMLLLNDWEITRGNKIIRCSKFTYGPEKNIVYQSLNKGINLSTIVKASMADADALTKLQREYSSNFSQIINEVGAKIVNYKLPFYTLITESESSDENSGKNVYEVIADIFTRVNAAGVKVGNLEMFLSFFAAHFPAEDKEKIIEIHEQLSDNFELDLEPLLRFVFSLADLTQNQITRIKSFQKAITGLSEKVRKKEINIQKLLLDCEKAIRLSFNFLKMELGINSTKIIPSQNLLIPIFVFFYFKKFKKLEELNKTDRSKIVKWFLIGGMNSIYSSSPNNKIESDINIIKEKNDNFPLKELLKALKTRPPKRAEITKSDIVDPRVNVLRGSSGKMYLMLLYIALYKNKATDWAGKEIGIDNFTYHHIFPKEFMRENGEFSEEIINCLGNITIISGSVNSEISDTPPEIYLPEYNLDAVKKHFIPTQKNLWKLENLESFINKRLILIYNEISKLLKIR